MQSDNVRKSQVEVLSYDEIKVFKKARVELFVRAFVLFVIN